MPYVPNTTGLYTLAELAEQDAGRAVDPTVVHTLIDCQPLFDQALLVPCNDGSQNKTEIVTSYPDLQAHAYNEGVDPVKAHSHFRTDATAMFSAYTVIDAKMFKRNNNSASWRARQEERYLRGFAHGMATRVFQASLKKDPKSFDGFGVRYTKASDQVIDALAGASVTSGHQLADIWLINWDPALVHLIHPQQGLAGLVATDRGEQDVYDANGKRFRGLITDYDWDMGLAVEDPYQVIRIANIDVTALAAGATASGMPDLQALMIQASERLPEDAGAQCAFYMPKAIREALRLQMRATANLQLTPETIAGRKVQAYDGVPVHKLPNSVLGTYTAAIGR